MKRRTFLKGCAATGFVAGCAPVDPFAPTTPRADFPYGLEPYDPTPYQEPEPLYQEPEPQQFDRQGPTPTSRYVSYNGTAAPNTILINRATYKLYYIQGNGQAIEYTIGVGRDGTGVLDSRYTIAWKTKNPTWTPTENMRDNNPSLPQEVAGGSPSNPLGSRALYIHNAITGKDTILRIHGTRWEDRGSVGTSASSGCFRMLNEDVEDLYNRTSTPTALLTYNNPNYTPGIANTTSSYTTQPRFQ